MNIARALIKEISSIPYHIKAKVSQDSQQYVQFIKHNLTASNEGSLSRVQIGEMAGTNFVYTYLAMHADSLLEKMDKFVESGDHSGVDSIELVVIEDKYRLVLESPNDTHEVEFTDIGMFEKLMIELPYQKYL